MDAGGQQSSWGCKGRDDQELVHAKPARALLRPLGALQCGGLQGARWLASLRHTVLGTQWLKTYFDQQTGGRGVHDYDGVARRALCKTGDAKGSGAGAAPASKAGTGAGAAAPAPHGAGYAGRLAGAPASERTPTGAGAAAGAGVPPLAKRAPSQKLSAAGSGGVKAAAGGTSAGVRSRAPSDDGALEQLQAEVATWRTAADTATKEKDFYVGAGGVLYCNLLRTV